MCTIQQSILYLTFLWKFFDSVLITFADPFANTLPAAFIVYDNNQLSIILVKYSTFWQLHVVELQISFSCALSYVDFLHSFEYVSSFHFFDSQIYIENLWYML